MGPLPTMADLLNPEHANLVATSVLLECVNQHYRIGQFGGRTDKIPSTTNMAKIRAVTKELASLEYEAAARPIGKRNAMHAANGIQIGCDENAYWEIILKGVKALDPATLPKGAPKDLLMVSALWRRSRQKIYEKRWLWNEPRKPAAVSRLMENLVRYSESRC